MRSPTSPVSLFASLDDALLDRAFSLGKGRILVCHISLPIETEKARVVLVAVLDLVYAFLIGNNRIFLPFVMVEVSRRLEAHRAGRLFLVSQLRRLVARRLLWPQLAFLEAESFRFIHDKVSRLEASPATNVLMAIEYHFKLSFTASLLEFLGFLVVLRHQLFDIVVVWFEVFAPKSEPGRINELNYQQS